MLLDFSNIFSIFVTHKLSKNNIYINLKTKKNE